MNTTTTRQRVPTRFERETRFTVKPKSVASGVFTTRNVFQELHTRLLQPVLDDADPNLRRQLRLAANEAAAVAWSTPFPVLVLPVLMEEKTAEAFQYALRQEQVAEATHLLLEASQ